MDGLNLGLYLINFMSDNKLKVGIAGYGVVGRKRKVYIDQNPHLETSCVSDISFSNSIELEKGVHFFKNYNELSVKPF